VIRTIFRALAALAVVFAFGLPPAAAQTGQMFGELVGKVTDDQGGVLPGVTVTLTGPAAMGAPTAVSNEQGRYRFPAVNSGTYTLKFDLAGFAPMVRRDIVVPVRQTITVDAALKLASLQETVTVSGSSPTVDVENTKVGARLSQEILTAVPTSRTIFGATTVLPGMTMGRQDPGGLNAATSTGMVAHGASNYNLNYYGVAADTPQDYGKMYYMDFGSAEEVSVDTAAMGAEVGGGGGANINVIPKSGGNQVKGEVVYSATGRGYWKGFSGDNVTDSLRAQGIKDPTLQKLNDTNLNAGGPFVKDRLWWFGSFREYNTHENVAGFGPLAADGTRTPQDFLSNLRNYTASGKYQINKSNQLSAFWTYNRKYQPNRGAGIAQPNPIGTINQQSPKNLFNGNWTSVFGQNTFLEVSSSYFHMHWPSRYSDEFLALSPAQQTPATFNLTTSVWTDGPEPTGERFRDAYRAQTNIGVTRYMDGFLGASHQLKTGFENWYGWGTEGWDVAGDTVLEFRNNAAGVPQPAQIVVFNTPLAQRTRMRNVAAFVQDRASYSRVTLNLGLRWSYYDGYLPEQTGGGGAWAALFPLTTYPRLDAPYNWNTIAPRTGIVIKLTEDGKNVAKASYSRYYEVMYTGEFADVINPNTINPVSASNGTGGLATFPWFGDLNGNGRVDDNEYNHTASTTFRPSVNQIDPKLKDPRNDEIMFAYQRELASNWSLTVDWIQRWFNDLTFNEEIGIPANGYTPQTFNDPGPDNLVGTADDRPITLYNVLPQYRGQNVSFHTNFPGTQRYKAIELSVSKRMSDRWQFLGSYVWSRLDGDLLATTGTLAGDPNNPNQVIPTQATGRGANDQPHAFKLLGSYQAPYGITFGANYQALSGLPIDRTFRAALAQGSTTVRADPRGTYRADFLNLLSVRADKGFRFGGQRRIGVIAEVHNVLNSSAGQSSYGSLTQAYASQTAFESARTAGASYFGRVQEIVAPRVLKIGVKLDF
jgi:hypothetical protein